MESPTTVPQYNSKKRVFPGGTSSSGCKEVEALEITSISGTSKRNSSKQKEDICLEIIDVDSEEDRGDIMRIDGEADTRAKGKEAMLCSSSVGFSSIENDGFGKDIQTPIDDFSSNLFYEEDEWVDADAYYDDMLYDDYEIMESKFDHMDIPPGVEAPFPWLSNSPRNNTNVLTTSTSTNSGSQLKSAGINLTPVSNSSHSSCPLEPFKKKDLSTSWSSSMRGIEVQPLKEIPSEWLGHGLGQKKSATSSSTSFLSSKPSGDSLIINSGGNKESLHLIKSKRRSRAFKVHSNLQGFHSVYQSTDSGNSYPPLNMPTSAYVETYSHAWDTLEHSLGSAVYMNENLFVTQAKGPANNDNGASPVGTTAPPTVKPKDLDEILQKFDLFKKFESVEDYSDHHYSGNGSSAKQPPKNWAKRIQEEWKILENNLPDTIFVRVYESRMDLLRAVMVGAEGTPYHDGLFFFDVYFPSTYPNVPPHVHYHSGGLRINPNLYNCGKVCLSLLNTWTGRQKEKWVPGVSTMLQVLVSIQGLILNAKPYFNEPGYANSFGSEMGEKSSLDYNERTFMYSLQTMVYKMRRPPKHFEDFVVGHFCKHARDILVSCKAYLDGAQVGCLVKGGVQDVDEGDKSCSQHFKNNLAGFITVLVNAFSQIGAKDCEEFLSLAQKGNGQATATSSRGLALLG
ncbi:hypothetical protein RD792_007311 [Penstemon davidsonii]|uniref:UBC core domain-containing protein n=1 Tax=Penstemon davidsonii TaxID=160366 RepID=A0ABR0D643_9LAMI|nr:hypothetical protein RD792_007311 [Penstemon davidsonii]